MVYQVPLVYTVRRPFKANGVSFTKGQALTAAQAKKLRLGVLVANGKLTPDLDVHARQGHRYIGAQATHIKAGAYPQTSLSAGTISYTTQGTAPNANLTFTASFNGPTHWWFGDGSENTSQTNKITHKYTTVGSKTVTATSRSRTATTTATVA
jgi:PKD repeat protein